VYERESGLYADVEADQDGGLGWNDPRRAYVSMRPFASFVPPALRVAEAMEQLGLFTPKGLMATSEIWGSLEYRDKEDHHDGQRLTKQLLARLHSEALILDTAKEEHVSVLYRDWQIPMYNLDFSLIPVTLEELQAEQEAEYWSMVGDPR